LGLPRGITAVTGGVGRLEVLGAFAGEVSFFGFLTILLLRCSPFGMTAPIDVRDDAESYGSCGGGSQFLAVRVAAGGCEECALNRRSRHDEAWLYTPAKSRS